MHLSTSETGRDLRGGLVAPNQNSNSKKLLLLIRSLNHTQIFTGVYEGRFLYSSHYIATRTIGFLDTKNLVESLNFNSVEIFLVIFRTGQPVSLTITKPVNRLRQKQHNLTISCFRSMIWSNHAILPKLFALMSTHQFFFLILCANCPIYMNFVPLLLAQLQHLMIVRLLDDFTGVNLSFCFLK